MNGSNRRNSSHSKHSRPVNSIKHSSSNRINSITLENWKTPTTCLKQEDPRTGGNINRCDVDIQELCVMVVVVVVSWSITIVGETIHMPNKAYVIVVQTFVMVDEAICHY